MRMGSGCGGRCGAARAVVVLGAKGWFESNAALALCSHGVKICVYFLRTSNIGDSFRVRNRQVENGSIVRQGNETYKGLTLLYAGVATQIAPEFVGDIKFRFPKSQASKRRIMRFDWVSSVLYCDELLWSKDSYPYFSDVNQTNGVYRVEGSSYLKRIENYFPDHLHYIYFDADFNWHITARGVEDI